MSDASTDPSYVSDSLVGGAASWFGTLGAYRLYVGALFTIGQAVLWLVFWISVNKRQESVSKVLATRGFVEVTSIIGITGAVVALALVNLIESEAVSVILASIVGYALGRAIKD